MIYHSTHCQKDCSLKINNLINISKTLAGPDKKQLVNEN